MPAALLFAERRVRTITKGDVQVKERSIFSFKRPVERTGEREIPFYDGGLRFSCVRCSNCCRHSPGYVFLIRRDVARLLVATRLDSKTFRERYLREVNLSGIRRISLIEKPNYDCIFWEQDGCSVYRHRPMQCRSYPFWSGNLVSRHSWEQLNGSCPGIGIGHVHSRREIERWIRKAEETWFLSTFAEME